MSSPDQKPLHRWSDSFIESSPDPYAVFDPSGAILALNPAAETLLAYRGGEAVGRPASTLFPTMNWNALRLPRRLFLDARRGDGTLLPVEATLTPVESGSTGRVVARIGPRPPEAAAGGMEGGSAEREPSISFGNSFLTVLSHELRTPLQAMLGWIHVIGRRPRDEGTVDRGLSAIERNVHQQAQVLDDLLDMMEIASGRLSLKVERVPVGALIEEVMRQVSDVGAPRGVRWSSVLPAEELAVLFDPGRLRRVVQVLLLNAIRFSGTGGSIEVELRAAGPNVEILVTDANPTGEAGPYYVYDEFRHGPPASTRGFGKLGIGLSNVQKIVELQGGSVLAKSAGLGRGASFGVSLPLVP